MKLLVFGLGYSCLYFVRTRGFASTVVGTTTGRETAARLAGQGIRTVQFHGTDFDPWLATAIRDVDAVIASAPPDVAGDPVLRVFAAYLRASNRLARVVYLSTIGVYGDHAGGWVDEDTPPRPVSARSRERLSAESAWRRFGEETGKSVHILRLAGIYGPSRNALVSVAQGSARRIIRSGQVFNRVHVEDIARALSASLATSIPAGVWNVADDEPASGSEVIEYAAHLLRKAPPPAIAFEDADLTEMAKSFYGESKRVSNRRLKQRLGVAFAFPSYREGLEALHAAGEGEADT